MKFVIRYFFRVVRLLLKPVMLAWARFGMPKGIIRPAEVQQKVDEQTSRLALYHFKTCPFCIKVRREISRMSLNIELRDAQHVQLHRDELMQDGGKAQVPCLRISSADGNVQWLYESDAINQYLRQRFGG